MGKSVIGLGCQFGDEGKGKITHFLSKDAHVIGRYHGGPNAGHTVIYEGETYILHHLPSGILRPNVQCVMAGGMVIDPRKLLMEIAELEERGIAVREQLHIAETIHLILPIHIALDEAHEEWAGLRKIGTTKRGIGPVYTDKVARRGIRLQDLFDEHRLFQQLAELYDYHNFILRGYYRQPTRSVHEAVEILLSFRENIKGLIGDMSRFLYLARENGNNIFFEGAHGTYLDIDHGTYPYVTSSNCVAAQAAVGSGIGPNAFDEILGIAKAYATRVGAGPFLTELTDATGDHLRKIGIERGATTGRDRRCGWLDLPQVRRAVELNGITSLVVTKLDVLSELPEIKVCTGYEIDGLLVDRPPFGAAAWADCQPIYATLPGWQSDIRGVKDFVALPKAAQNYLFFIEEQLGLSISIVSTGADEEDTIVRRNPFG